MISWKQYNDALRIKNIFEHNRNAIRHNRSSTKLSDWTDYNPKTTFQMYKCEVIEFSRKIHEFDLELRKLVKSGDKDDLQYVIEGFIQEEKNKKHKKRLEIVLWIRRLREEQMFNFKTT